jgi:hypothetical protein
VFAARYMSILSFGQKSNRLLLDTANMWPFNEIRRRSGCALLAFLSLSALDAIWHRRFVSFGSSG